MFQDFDGGVLDPNLSRGLLNQKFHPHLPETYHDTAHQTDTVSMKTGRQSTQHNPLHCERSL